jgi:hypothetical protein
MRKLTFAIVGVLALVATSIAVAHGIQGAKTAAAVSGTFSAAPSGTVSTRTCTTTDNKTITITDGKYTGTADSSSADLKGAITVRARSVINTTDGVGTVSGQLRINPSSGGDTVATFRSVFDHGTVTGLAVGRVHQPGAALVANLSASFSPTSGFTNGKIGGGTAGGSAIEVSGGAGACRGAIPPTARTEALGTISALSAGSITVAGLTCGLPSAVAADVNRRYKTGDRVEIHCTFANGAMTLKSIEGRGHH